MTKFFKFCGFETSHSFPIESGSFFNHDTAITKFEIETRCENFRFFTKNNKC
jgi:hypothetical protein